MWGDHWPQVQPYTPVLGQQNTDHISGLPIRIPYVHTSGTRVLKVVNLLRAV